MAKMRPDVAAKLRDLGDMFIDGSIENAKEKLTREPPDYSEYRITSKGQTEKEIWEHHHSRNCIQALQLVEKLGRLITSVDEHDTEDEENEAVRRKNEEFDALMSEALETAGITKDDLKKEDEDDGGEDE